MRTNNLLGIQPKRFVVTTNSKHKCEVHLNLASRMRLTGINQIWVADIPYVRFRDAFVYLAVILDSFSRKVVGWAVDRALMSSRLTVAIIFDIAMLTTRISFAVCLTCTIHTSPSWKDSRSAP